MGVREVWAGEEQRGIYVLWKGLACVGGRAKTKVMSSERLAPRGASSRRCGIPCPGLKYFSWVKESPGVRAVTAQQPATREAWPPEAGANQVLPFCLFLPANPAYSNSLVRITFVEGRRSRCMVEAIGARQRTTLLHFWLDPCEE